MTSKSVESIQQVEDIAIRAFRQDSELAMKALDEDLESQLARQGDQECELVASARPKGWAALKGTAEERTSLTGWAQGLLRLARQQAPQVWLPRLLERPIEPLSIFAAAGKSACLGLLSVMATL